MTRTRPERSPAERVDALLVEMRALCTQINELGKEQQRLLDADELDGFVASLASRGLKIESLSKAGVQVEGYLEADGLGVDQVRSARRQLDEMSEMIVAILKRDAEQQAVVESRRDELSGQLSGIGKSRSAMRAYSGGDLRPSATLQDREC